MIDLSTLPTSPGIYIYRNSDGEIIYVGKAINLKRRVSQYFQRDDALGPKTKTLVSQIDSVETKTVNSEIEALVLEAAFIKKHKPKYNSQLRDDKNYVYICISKEPLPRVFSSHLRKLTLSAHTYGPFPDSRSVRSLLKTIRHLFPYRSLERHPSTPCLYCHLHLCPGPNPDPVIYRQTIGKIRKILSGNITSLRRQLETEMKNISKIENYESALVVRDQLQSLNYIVSGWRNLQAMFSRIELPDDFYSQAILELSTILQPYFSGLNLNRIECYDISQLGSKYFVGSMTVWENGQLDHTQYRHFRIKSKSTPDDQFMLREMVWRRLRHPEWGTPNLIVVDGGRPQVSSISQITDLPLIGLAKKFETIVLENNHVWQEINLPPQSPALRLLEQLRNEAHRFANKYRQQLISLQMQHS